MRTVVALAIAGASLLVPTEASAFKAFKLGVPKGGEISVARVELRVRARLPGTKPVVRGLRVANARRLPKRVFVAARLRRVPRTNRYIARAVILNQLPAAAQGAQDALPRRSVIFDLVGNGRSRLFDSAFGVDVITDPAVPDICFGPQSDDEWSHFTPLVHVDLVAPRDVDDLAQAARDFLCARPIPRYLPNEFRTLEPVPAFAGVHKPFKGSRVEHVFRVHGNEDMGSFSIEPPEGGTFVGCAGAPCILESGRVLVPGPFPAGQDVDVNARADVDIPRRLEGEIFPGDSGGVFNGPPRRYRLKLGFRF
jgi:hypothetical protein